MAKTAQDLEIAMREGAVQAVRSIRKKMERRAREERAREENRAAAASNGAVAAGAASSAVDKNASDTLTAASQSFGHTFKDDNGKKIVTKIHVDETAKDDPKV